MLNTYPVQENLTYDFHKKQSNCRLRWNILNKGTNKLRCWFLLNDDRNIALILFSIRIIMKKLSMQLILLRTFSYLFCRPGEYSEHNSKMEWWMYSPQGSCVILFEKIHFESWSWCWFSSSYLIISWNMVSDISINNEVSLLDLPSVFQTFLMMEV